MWKSSFCLVQRHLFIQIWGVLSPPNRAEESAEAFREQKLVMLPFLNLLFLLSVFTSMAEQFNLKVFGLWGDAVQCYIYFNVKIISGAISRWRIAWNGKEPWLKYLLDGFLSHVFLGKALGVPGACSLCSPLFSTMGVGWLDNLDVMLNSVQLNWNLTYLDNFNNARNVSCKYCWWDYCWILYTMFKLGAEQLFSLGIFQTHQIANQGIPCAWVQGSMKMKN